MSPKGCTPGRDGSRTHKRAGQSPQSRAKRESPMSAAEGPLVIGVDSSTQSTKALVVDASTGQVVASGQGPHTVSTGAGGAERPAAAPRPPGGGPRERPPPVVGRALRSAAPVRRRRP